MFSGFTRVSAISFSDANAKPPPWATHFTADSSNSHAIRNSVIFRPHGRRLNKVEIALFSVLISNPKHIPV